MFQILYRGGTGYGRGFEGTGWVTIQGTAKQVWPCKEQLDGRKIVILKREHTVYCKCE
jgi:hypothetical protein